MESQTNTPTQHLTPTPAIRAKCLDCGGQSALEVRLCPVSRCPLWPYRFGASPEFDSYQGQNLNDEIVIIQVQLTALRAIKAKCADCGSDGTCDPAYSWCPLFQCLEQPKYKRLPKRTRILSEEERQRRSERMKALNGKLSPKTH